MTPEELAALHAKAFPDDRAWSAREFEELLAADHTLLFSCEVGFALIRIVAAEAELLTIGVDPQSRRRGIADELMNKWMAEVKADIAFLEVSEDNAAACALYTKHGFTKYGRRKDYYRRSDGSKADALLMKATLPPRHFG